MSTYISTRFYRIYREFNSLKSHATGSSVKLRNFFPLPDYSHWSGFTNEFYFTFFLSLVSYFLIYDLKNLLNFSETSLVFNSQYLLTSEKYWDSDFWDSDYPFLHCTWRLRLSFLCYWFDLHRIFLLNLN